MKKNMSFILALVLIINLLLPISSFAATPTVESFTINNGDVQTTSNEVELNMTVTDAVYMQFSNNNIDFSPLEPYSSYTTWDITDSSYGGTSEFGTKTVYARFLNEDKSEEVTTGATIEYINEDTISGGNTVTFNIINEFGDLVNGVTVIMGGQSVEVVDGQAIFYDVPSGMTIYNIDTDGTIYKPQGSTIDVNSDITVNVTLELFEPLYIEISVRSDLEEGHMTFDGGQTYTSSTSLEDAIVKIDGEIYFTNFGGFVRIEDNLELYKPYSIEISKDGFITITDTITLTEEYSSRFYNANLQPIFKFTGNIYDSVTNELIQDAVLNKYDTYIGGILNSINVADGFFNLEFPIGESYGFIADAEGYEPAPSFRYYPTPGTTEYDFYLNPVYGAYGIEYIDENYNYIAPSDFTGFTLPLGTFEVSAKSFEGYELDDIDTKTVTLTEDNPVQYITFKYKVAPFVEPQPEQQPEPENEPTPKPEPQPEPEQQPEPEPEPQPEPEQTPQQESQYELNPEPKSDKRSEAKPEPEPVKEDFGTVRGKAIDIFGNPIEGLKIELHSKPRVTYTDEKGEYLFENVEFGEHTIIVIDERFKTASKLEIVVKAANSNENIVVTNQTNAFLTLNEDIKEREVDIIVTPKTVSTDEDNQGNSIEVDDNSDFEGLEPIDVPNPNSTTPDMPDEQITKQQPEPVIDETLPQTGESGLIETVLFIFLLPIGIWFIVFRRGKIIRRSYLTK